MNVVDNTGSTPLHEAVISNSNNIINALVKAGANVEARNDGFSPLFYSIKSPITTKTLIDCGADVNALGLNDPLIIIATVMER